MLARRGLGALLVVGLALSSSAACGNVETTAGKPCNEAPFECAAGETCWPNESNAFQCLPVGVGKSGDACQLVVGAPTCGEALICLMQGTTGTCTPYCVPYSSDHDCYAMNQVCAQFTLGEGGVQLSACQAKSSTGSTGTGN